MEKFEIIDVETMIPQGTKEIGFGEFDGCANLTEVDIQLCILLKLRFTVSQIAILTATSPSSVSVQKNRLKKRLLQKDEHLFESGQTLDMYLWMY